MKATILMENTAPEGLCAEWGFCVYIVYRGKRYLLDTGASPLFLKNAEMLGIDMASVDAGILSHAHYDHADGLEAFFTHNDHAYFYLRSGAAEDCYSGDEEPRRYIGICRGVLEKYADRIRMVEGNYRLDEGVTLVPHRTPQLEQIGEKDQLYRLQGESYIPDNFAHEQSLVMETDKGLVIFNSCSHGGADTIIREVAETFPGKKIYAIVGGFHLFKREEQEVREFARRVEETGIQMVYTGHCTGDVAVRILQEMLGEKMVVLTTGMEIIL